MDRREKTRYTGVFKLTSTVRRHEGKPDICYYIYYKQAGRLVKEKVGWASEGYSASVAANLREERVQATRHGADFAERQRAARHGPDTLTFGQAWEIFDAKYLPTLARPQDERSRYRLHLAPAFAAKRLDMITPLDIEDFRQAAQARGLSASYQRLLLGDIRRVYRQLAAWGVYSGPSPMDGVKMPRPDNARVRYLTAEEAQALMAELRRRSPLWHNIAMTSLHTGMRLGEVLALRGSDLDFAASVIHVRDAKTGSRMAHMNADIKALLREACPADKTALLFATRRGTPIAVTATSKTFSRAVEAVGLNNGIADSRQRVVFHTLRHTFCSWLAMAGESLYTIGELVGHSSAEMTKRYAHLCPDTKKSAVARICDMATVKHAPPAAPPRRASRSARRSIPRGRPPRIGSRSRP